MLNGNCLRAGVKRFITQTMIYVFRFVLLGFLLSGGLFVSLYPVRALAQAEGIAAVVNEEAISISDVKDRMQLIMVSSGLPDKEEVRQKVLPQVLDSLIEEQIKIQEAVRLELVVEDQEIDNAFGSIAQQNKMEPEQFKAVLKRSGINITTMHRQIRAQIAWSKVIQARIRPQIKITERDIDAYLERLKQNIGKQEFLLAEIYLPFESQEQEREVKQLADKLIGEIRNNRAPFFKLAQQFSKSPGAEQGGDLGWIPEGQLPEEVDAELLKTDKGSVTNAVRTTAGYYIMFVRDKRDVTQESLPSSDEALTTLGMERLERQQRRYYLDLKAEAYVDRRFEELVGAL